MKGKYDEHYKNLSPQPIEVIENWELDFHLANVLKYISRAGKKAGESELKDLEKAQVYLERKIFKIKGSVKDNAWGYEVGQVWTCSNNPEYTLAIQEIYEDGMIRVRVTDGDFVDLVNFTECGRGDQENYFDFQLTVLKREG